MFHNLYFYVFLIVNLTYFCIYYKEGNLKDIYLLLDAKLLKGLIYYIYCFVI